MVNEFEKRFKEKFGVEFCRTTASGTAGIHTAVAAINPEPGDEVITSPITDMGALTPIIYQTAVPIFADVDPLTYNLTAATIAPTDSKISCGLPSYIYAADETTLLASSTPTPLQSVGR